MTMTTSTLYDPRVTCAPGMPEPSRDVGAQRANAPAVLPTVQPEPQRPWWAFIWWRCYARST